MLDANFYSIPAPRQYVMSRNGGYTTLAQMRQTYGWEASTQFGCNGYPAFMDTSHGMGPTADQNDLRLAPLSPCADTGADLSHLFAEDKDGNPRGSPWGMGAHNVVVLPTAPMPPTGLRPVAAP